MPSIQTFAVYLSSAWRLLVERLNQPRAAGLDELDDRALAVLGVSRSEIASVEAQWLGHSAVTRVCVSLRVSDMRESLAPSAPNPQ